MRKLLKFRSLQVTGRQQREHTALLFQFAMKRVVVRAFRHLGCKNIHSRQRYDQHTKHTDDDFEKDLSGQRSCFALEGQTLFYERMRWKTCPKHERFMTMRSETGSVEA